MGPLPFPAASVARLGEVPWGSLAGTAPALEQPLASVLGGAPAEDVLDHFLRSRRDLGPDGRRAAAEALFGVGLWRRRLEYHAGEGAGPLELLAVLVRDLAGLEGAEAICSLRRALPPRRPAPADLATFYSLPAWLSETLRREAGPGEAGEAADALNRPGPVFLRANRTRTERGALRLRLEEEGVLARPARFARDGLEVLSPRPNLLALPSFREGLFEVQDEGSQLLGLAVGAMAGDRVLDLCAGAGGKSLLLAAEVGERGEVHACDRDPERLDRLRRRASKAQAGNITVGGGAPPSRERFDRVLVDAPCSGLGALRRGPDVRFRVDPDSFGSLPSLQLELLLRGADAVRPGGRLVYATCTFRREENEEVVVAFERSRPSFERADALSLPPPRAGGLLSLWPHRHGTDGFFAAAWQRAAG